MGIPQDPRGTSRAPAGNVVRAGHPARSSHGDALHHDHWEILKTEGIDPAPDRGSSSWAAFLRSRAHALLACDFIETITLTLQRQYILAVIEHATRRIRILGTTAHPTADWVAQLARNLVVDLRRGRRGDRVPGPGQGRQVSRPVRPDPHRRRHHDRPYRRSHNA
jgi:hypothetical protein